jgi:hypothetical protein
LIESLFYIIIKEYARLARRRQALDLFAPKERAQSLPSQA